ncbi:MAG: VWA domain-containing protein [Pseudomonadota bacterium]
MSDDLDDLKRLMDAATPAPDAKAKARNIALAEKNFADLQGSPEEPRLTSDSPKKGAFAGVRQMFDTLLTSRAGLTASTALVAVGIVALTPLGQTLLRPGDLPSTEITTSPALAEEESAVFDLAAPAPMVAEPEVMSEPRVTDRLTIAGSTAVSPVPNGGRAKLSAQGVGQSAGVPVNEPGIVLQPNTEEFANADPNPVKVTREEPVSTFSIDVDTASYAIIRNALSNGFLPDPDAVRIEEMVNYFTYDYPAPSGGQAFQPTVSVTQTPWNPDTQLLQIGLQGALPDVADRPPLNLVFLIDTSGSMDQPNKLPLLKQSFRLMLSQLRPEDEIAIVTYAGSAGEVLAPTPAGERSTILAALDRLSAGGSTAGQAGLQRAYATAEAMSGEGEVSRVILATDGDFNVGLSDPDALKTYIEGKRDSGTYLSVLGFGRGNLDDATMQALAQNGNGTAAYIDTLSEAQKVLVDQLTGALFPIANEVKIQVEFNPAEVAEYRLIGYETRALRREDFNNDQVDAGDIGAGHQVTALYEVTPVGSPAVLHDDLRYGTADTVADTSDELAFLRLRYKAPGNTQSQLIETPIVSTSSGAAGFAAAVAGFGQLLRGSDYLGSWSWGDAIALANQTKGEDPFGYRTEAIQLMRLAQSLSE